MSERGSRDSFWFLLVALVRVCLCVCPCVGRQMPPPNAGATSGEHDTNGRAPNGFCWLASKPLVCECVCARTREPSDKTTQSCHHLGDKLAG